MSSNPHEAMPYYNMAGADYATEYTSPVSDSPWARGTPAPLPEGQVMEIGRQKHFGTLGSFEVRVEYLDDDTVDITRVEDTDRLGAMIVVNRWNAQARNFTRKCRYILL